MVTYEEAVKIALEKDSDFNRCTEFERYYYFFTEHDEERTGDGILVVIKETGECMPILRFALSGYAEEKDEPIRTVVIE